MIDGHEQEMKRVKVTSVMVKRITLSYEMTIPKDWPSDASRLDHDQRDYILENMAYDDEFRTLVDEYVDEETIIKVEDNNE